ncbi:hypothetical protein C8R45DRAFT_1085072 [Mycena sanguinolenta]|nr:hypothetical protein C8R45DRAFT_1085072 [Mycena sanguinolenta]
MSSADISVEAFTSILSTNPTSTPLGLLLVGVVGGKIYYTSPMRLTRVLVAAIADTEKTYLTAAENGVFCASTDKDAAERLSILQLRVSTIRETSLRSSLSPFSALFDLLNIPRTVSVLRCLGEVRGLRTHIEVYLLIAYSISIEPYSQISNESQLREVDSHRLLSHRASIFLRKRNSRI